MQAKTSTSSSTIGPLTTPPGARAWLAANPNVTFHFTPIGSSWLNQIEIWFGIIARQAIRRGTFTSVNALVVRRRRALHLDRDRRRNPSQGPLGPDQHQTTRRKQLEIIQTGSRHTCGPILCGGRVSQVTLLASDGASMLIVLMGHDIAPAI